MIRSIMIYPKIKEEQVGIVVLDVRMNGGMLMA